MSNIFLFGQSGVGKSTISACICYFFHEAKGLSPRYNIKNRDGSRLALAWVKQLRNHQFPFKTDTGLFQRVDVGFVDRRSGDEVPISFYEVAGENVVMLDPLHYEHESRPTQLDDWLERADTILIIGSCLPQEDDRFVMQMFIEYLRYRDVRIPVAFVISEWDRVSPGTHALDFAREHYSEVLKGLAEFSRRGIPTEVLTFSVGEVRQIAGVAEIVRVSFSAGTESLVRWLVEVQGT